MVLTSGTGSREGLLGSESICSTEKGGEIGPNIWERHCPELVEYWENPGSVVSGWAGRGSWRALS